MNRGTLIAHLPDIENWIRMKMNQHRNLAEPISELGFKRLLSYYDNELLECTKVVYVDAVPFPPVQSLGLEQLNNMSSLNMAGITFDDVIFIHKRHKTESIHFHELVHTLQWKVLGFQEFLLVYALSIVMYGYQKCPLETMAYSYQEKFDQRVSLPNLVNEIETSTLKIRDSVLG